MEMKLEKGQLRWKLLVFMFSACTALIYPIIFFCLDNVKSITGEHSALDIFVESIVYGVPVSTLAVIPVCICVLLQKNWPLKVKLRAILIVTIYFEVLGFVILRFFTSFMFILIFKMPLIIFIPVIPGLLIYSLVLNKYHKEYDKIEYKVISKQENMPLQKIYTCLGIATICVCAIPSEVGYIFNPLSIVISLCISLPIQIVVLLQKGWTTLVKWRNIILIDIVFLSVGFIVNVLFNIFLIGWWVIPFVLLAGCVLLKHIFIKSSLDALERKE